MVEYDVNTLARVLGTWGTIFQNTQMLRNTVNNTPLMCPVRARMYEVRVRTCGYASKFYVAAILDDDGFLLIEQRLYFCSCAGI